MVHLRYKSSQHRRRTMSVSTLLFRQYREATK